MTIKAGHEWLAFYSHDITLGFTLVDYYTDYKKKYSVTEDWSPSRVSTLCEQWWVIWDQPHAGSFVQCSRMFLWVSMRKRTFCTVYYYSWLSLSRRRLSRITAYLEVKIWSLLKNENLITGNKILWKRGEIAPKEQFLLFSTIFSTYVWLQESNYIYIC